MMQQTLKWVFNSRIFFNFSILVWRRQGWDNLQKWHWISLLGNQRRENPWPQPRLPPQDSGSPHLGDLCQWELGRPLQPKQGLDEVLLGREQVPAVLHHNPIFQYYIPRFHLFYYSSTVVGKEPKDTLLIIDTRGVKVAPSVDVDEEYDDIEEDPLADAIQTK